MSYAIRMLMSTSLLCLVMLGASLPEAHANTIKRVPTKQVCMINDEFMAKKQIPVDVDGKTYYGCCQACYNALKSDARTRYSVDPVTGNKVDKALAVIGALSNGKVFYFESEKTFRAYQKKLGS